MKKHFSILLLFTALFSYSQTTYYVSNIGIDNTTNGSQATPWLTIDYAINQLSPGDLLVVESGTYNELVNINAANSGTLGNSITLQSNGAVLIDGTGITPSGRKGLITIQGASNIIIDGFELANYQTKTPVVEDNNTPIGILVEGTCSNIIIKNNSVHDIKNFSSCSDDDGCGTGANGIAIYGSTPNGITDIQLINNEVYSCQTASSEVFTINGNVSNFKVLDNNVHDNNNIGYDFIGYESDTCPNCTTEQNRARNGIVKGNTAKNNSIFGSSTSSPPVPSNPWYASSVNSNEGSAGGFYVDGGQNIIFDGNISTGNDLGFEFASENVNSACEDILMINNYIYNNKENGVIIGGFSPTENDPNGGGGDAVRIYIYNNSFYKNKGWGSEIVFQSRVKDSRISNNIFYGKGTALESHEDFDASSNTNNTWGSNIWYGTNTNRSGNLPGVVIAQNPNFVDPSLGNLDLQASSVAAIDSGNIENNISTWTNAFWDTAFPPHGEITAQGSLDIKKASRLFGSAIDFGAHEFGSALSAVKENLQIKTIKIHPNPAKDRIFIQTQTTYHLNIINTLGEIIYTGKTDSTIDISSFSNGLYFVKFMDINNTPVITKSLIISN